MLQFPLRILSCINFLEIAAALSINPEVGFDKEFIFPRGQLRPCPFSDMALGHQWSVSCCGKRAAAAGAYAWVPLPSVQYCTVLLL